MFAPHVAVKKMKGYLAGASQCDATVGRRERDCMSSAAVAHSQLSNITSCNSESGVARLDLSDRTFGIEYYAGAR
jgi:hypothetical protein